MNNCCFFNWHYITVFLFILSHNTCMPAHSLHMRKIFHSICSGTTTRLQSARAKGGGDAGWGAKFDAMLRQKKLDNADMSIDALENKVYNKVITCLACVS